MIEDRKKIEQKELNYLKIDSIYVQLCPHQVGSILFSRFKLIELS